VVTTISFLEPKVSLLIDGCPICLLLDIGDTFSVLTEFWGATSPLQTPIVGVGGQTIFPRKTPMFSCSFSGHPFAHQFLVMLQCPTPLLGRDILTKFQAFISLNLRPIPVLALMAMDGPCDSTSQILPSGVDPKVWDTDTPSLVTCPPIKILLQDPHHFLCQPQYPLPTPSLLGLQPIIADLLHRGLLRPTHSPYNSPILVKKPNGT
jgi:hypothetical protein